MTRLASVERGPYEVVLVGDVDLATAPSLNAHVRLCSLRMSQSAIVDLSGVTFFGSTGLSFLVALRQSLAGGGGEVTVYCPPSVERVMRLEGFQRAFLIVAAPHPVQLTATLG